MPEGDTIFRTAATLRKSLEGGAITAATARDGVVDCDVLVGNRLAAIEARGKHLLMHLASGHAVHSHMGMTGSWHVYHPQQPWRKGANLAALVMRVAALDAVCFSPKLLELLSADRLRRHPHLNRLGPDLLGAEFDVPAAIARFRRRNALPLGEAVMDQTIVCGIGNVYKSDLLFVLGFDPFAAVAQFTDDELGALLQRAQALMKRNLSGAPRQTRFRGDGRRLWVYGRSGDACFTCGAAIQLRRQGDAGRTTCWCPVCQPARR